MKNALLLLCLLSSSCVPVVQHGPWVRQGSSGSLGSSFVVVKEAGEGGAPGPLISFDGSMRWGHTTNDTTHEGFSLGVQVPLVALLAAGDFETGFWQLIHLDGYVVIPATKTLNASFGISGSSFHTMPYLQLGKYDKWYTTQAVMFESESGGKLWAPSFTWVGHERGGNRTHITVTGGLGTDNSDVYWLAGFSIIFEFARARN